MTTTMSKNSNDNPVYLTYHEATIYKNDLHFLNDGAWLNDHIILFMYEYLNYNVKYQEIIDKICLCHPMNTMLLQYGDMEDLSDISNSLKFSEKEYIFIPVNNASYGEFSQNGTHWALILVDFQSKTFLIYDSMGKGSSATKNSLQTIKNLSKLIDPKNEFSTIDVNVPRQKNGYDCGMYCICFSEIILDALLLLLCRNSKSNSDKNEVDNNNNNAVVDDSNNLKNTNDLMYIDEIYLKTNCTPQHITTSRKRFRNLIDELRGRGGD